MRARGNYRWALGVVAVCLLLVAACDEGSSGALDVGEALDVGGDVLVDVSTGPDVVPGAPDADAEMPDVDDVSPSLDVIVDATSSSDSDAGADVVPDVTPDVAVDTYAPDVPRWDPDAGPPEILVTVNRIPAVANGSTPYLGSERPDSGFQLRLPTGGFTVDVRAHAADGGPPVSLESLTVTATPGDGEPKDVSAELVWDGDWASWTLPEGHWEPGQLTIEASVEDVLGNASETSALTVELAPLMEHLDPFVTEDVWLVTFSRDIFELTLVDAGDGTLRLEPTYLPGGNGVADFDEAFLALGLFSDNAEVTEVVRRRFVARLRELVYAIYGTSPDGAPGPDGVPVRFYFEGDEGAPLEEDFAAGGFSRIAIGGDGDEWDIDNGIVGRAWLDANNQSVEDNAEYRRGVYTSQIARMVMGNPVAMMLGRELSPALGTPLGGYPGDEEIVTGTWDPATSEDPRLSQRYGVFTLLFDALAIATATTLSHEMGHSLGLVPPGVPPAGLFARVEDLPWVASPSEGWHLDTPGLNIMQTGSQTNWLEAVGQQARFNELNLAYLRGRLIVDPAAAGKSGPIRADVGDCPCSHPNPAHHAPGPAPLERRLPVRHLAPLR